MGQAGEHIAEISIRINAPAAAAFDDGVEDEAPLFVERFRGPSSPIPKSLAIVG
jgi:hypothetical protein